MRDRAVTSQASAKLTTCEMPAAVITGAWLTACCAAASRAARRGLPGGGQDGAAVRSRWTGTRCSLNFSGSRASHWTTVPHQGWISSAVGRSAARRSSSPLTCALRSAARCAASLTQAGGDANQRAVTFSSCGLVASSWLQLVEFRAFSRVGQRQHGGEAASWVACGLAGPVDAVFRGEQRELVLLRCVKGLGVRGGQPCDDLSGEVPPPGGGVCPGVGDVGEVDIVGAVTVQEENQDIG